MAVVNELAAIPFGTLIGAPLNAAIEAQAKAAMTTVEFIRAVGFKPAQDGRYSSTVVFAYARTAAGEKQLARFLGHGADAAASLQMLLDSLAQPAASRELSPIARSRGAAHRAGCT